MSPENKRSPLDDLENELLASTEAPLPEALGERVIGAVRGDLRRARFREWAFTVARAAAVAVLWLNLSWSVVNRIEDFKPERPEARSLDSVARDIQRILPRTTNDQALAFALTLRAARHLDRCPVVRRPPGGRYDLSPFRRQP